MATYALLLLTVLSTLIGVAATIRVFRWPERSYFSPHRMRDTVISILKPIRGLEPDLEVNLHSFFNLSKRVPFELLLSVKNPDDPAIPVIRRLMKMHPHVRAQLFVNTPDLGRNPKVSNMHYAWNRASSDLILISDSNVRVEPYYLEMLLEERAKGAGLVTQAIYGVGANSIGGHLDVIALNTFYLKATAFLQQLGRANVLGKCMLFSRKDFEEVGGLFAVRNYLAEDLIAGEMLKAAGHKIILAPELLRQTSVISNFEAFWNRHTRWARLRKCHYPFAYVLEPLLFETVWPIALWIWDPSWRLLAAGFLTLQILSNLALHAYKFRDSSSWRSFLWFPVKDLMAPVIWFGGLVSNNVHWRGQVLKLRFGGKLSTGRYRYFTRPSWSRLTGSL